MTQQLILDIVPVAPQTLENFVTGSNHALLQALQDCSPGRAIYIWGPAGSGRTHLLRAISHDRAGRYFSAQEAQDALGELATADHLGYPCIAVDDVHQLTDRAQAGLFSLYNRWRESAGGAGSFSLILAGDHAPVAMAVREDLRSRLGWDLVFQVHSLSDDDLAQALYQRAEDRGLNLAPEVVNWLLVHTTRNMGQLGSLIDALDRYSLQRQRRITLPLLKDLLARDTQDTTSLKQPTEP